MQAACLQLWAVDFWQSGCYREEDSVNLYVQGKLTPLTRLEAALELLRQAVAIQEKSKEAFKSAAIAEARTKCESAAEILAEIAHY